MVVVNPCKLRLGLGFGFDSLIQLHRSEGPAISRNCTLVFNRYEFNLNCPIRSLAGCALSEYSISVYEADLVRFDCRYTDLTVSSQFYKDSCFAHSTYLLSPIPFTDHTSVLFPISSAYSTWHLSLPSLSYFLQAVSMSLLR